MLKTLQERWLALYKRQMAARYKLEDQYGRTWNAPSGKRTAYDALANRVDAAMEDVFAWLDANSPRSWRTGVPAYWVCESLTETDARTAGQLSIMPPCACGRYPSDAERFAQPVREAVAAGW